MEKKTYFEEEVLNLTHPPERYYLLNVFVIIILILLIAIWVKCSVHRLQY